ncbi:MAG TPA: EF-hand domain-containing protein, partial [Hyphomonadaceae bacterium]
KSLTFQGSGLNGLGDTYLAVFEYNSRNISIGLGPDGKVSGFMYGPILRQTPEQLKSSFKAIDRNGDGQLDHSEYGSMLDRIGFLQMFDSLFRQVDDNGDGLITAAEYEANPQQ